MKSRVPLALFVLLYAVLLLPAAGQARNISPIVSTDWLMANLRNPKLIILDIRRIEDYREGHIPGAVSAFTALGPT